MDIRDVIHGAIFVHPSELSIIDSIYFQRLRQIKQMGFSEYSYPTANHSRYMHSLGAMHVASQAFDQIFERNGFDLSSSQTHWNLKKNLPDAFEKLRAVIRLAALLHDVGHGPLSHTTEFAMPHFAELQVPFLKTHNTRQATHEDYTLKIILDSPLTPILENLGKRFGFGAYEVGLLIHPELSPRNDFFKASVEGVSIDFLPLLQQLISSELDADRMDYLRRDSYYSGVSYGDFDFNWLLSCLTGTLKDNRLYLCLNHRGLYTFEDFLLSRFHMFLMVYFHHKGVIYDEMLRYYLHSEDCDYRIPADIEEYAQCDDMHLWANLLKSSNPWARKIVQKQPHRMLIEIHSGIPFQSDVQQEQEGIFQKLREELERNKTPAIFSHSTSELSKYFGTENASLPIYVRYDNLYTPASFIPLEQCTSLFEKYREKRSILRLYVSPEDYRVLKAKKSLSQKTPEVVPQASL